MMDSSSETQGIDLLFKKLGHSIAEIRLRALDSIISKLEHGLLHEADIVQERQLMIRLLEWFNFQPSPKQDQVLKLLSRLTKHSSACDLLVSTGGVPFLSRVRLDIDADLRPQVDVIVDRLLHVADGNMLQASCPRRCIYEKGDAKEETKDKVSPTQEQLNYGYFTTHAEQNGDDTSSTLTPPIPRVAAVHGNIPRTSEPGCLRFYEFPWHSLTGTDRHVLASTGTSLCSPNVHLVRNACAFLLDVIFRDFPPEIFLQRPSIVQTLLTLISSRPGGQLMTGALECLQALTEGLISRVYFFQDPFFYCPRQGLPFHSNSRTGSHFSSINSFSESDLASRSDAEGAIRLERSGGDGRDGQSSSTSSLAPNSTDTQRATMQPTPHPHNLFQHGINAFTWNSSDTSNDDNAETNVALRRSQVTAPQLCLSALIATIPSLRTESIRLALSLLQTANPLVHLLSCLIRAEKFWEDKSTLAQSMQTQTRQLLETVGDALLYHYNLESNAALMVAGNETQDEWVSKRWTSHESRMHRLVYQAMVPMLLKLLQAILPIEQSDKEVKSSLNRALYVIACDEALYVSSTCYYELAQAYLEQCSPEKNMVVNRVKQTINSFAHTHMFLRDYKFSNNTSITMELMELAESSIDGLPYHCEVAYLKFIIQAISELFLDSRKTCDVMQLQTMSKRILTRLMAHPLVSMRRTVYEECLRIVRSAVNVNAAAGSTGHLASRICLFLLDTEVLYELSCHGLGDPSRLVYYPAQELIVILLEGRILMADDIWDMFCVSIKPVLPVLQAYTGETEVLGSAINGFISPKEHPVEDYQVEHIRACLRGLMLKHRGSRSAAATQLQHILNEENLASTITGLTDLLMVDTPLSLVPKDEGDCFRIRRCVFQEEAVVRMLSVFRSNGTDLSVRIGALRQLATMLDDSGLHNIFLANYGLDSVTDKLKDMVQDDIAVLTDDAKPALSACVMIMKLLLRRNAVSRERLSHDRGLLLALLRAADLCRLSMASLSEVSVVIALLVFHDCLREFSRTISEPGKSSGSFKTEINELSLPAAIVARYQVPFLCPTHHAVSIHRTVCTPRPLCDSLISGPPATALRIGWNIAQHDNDIVSLCEDLENYGEDEVSESESLDDVMNLHLTEEDRLFLTFSHPATLSCSLLDAIVSSQSHSAASHAFSLLRVAMISMSSSPKLITAILNDPKERWKQALGKFLQVLPSCYEDEVLLTNLTALLDETLRVVETNSTEILDGISSHFVGWLVENCILSTGAAQQMMEQNGSPLLKVLESSEPLPEPVSAPSSVHEPHISSVTVHRQLCKKILSLLSRTARLLPNQCNKEENDIVLSTEACERFHRELRTVILVRLRLADAPQFYDLPSMEVTLQCLVHISATRVACSDRNKKLLNDAISKFLSQQLLGTLLEIVSAFHIGSGASSLSYMGKGVSRCATQCILHLAREMAWFGISDWPNLLEYSVPSQSGNQQQSTEKMGLEWLIPLWSARDPRTRFAGLAIASVATKTKQGAITLANGFQRCPGGLWNTVLSVLLDHSECSAVRSQACDLLCGMLSYEFDEPSTDGQSWQGPLVQDERTGSTITGLPALLTLFHHTHVYEHLVLTLSQYHSESTVYPPVLMNNPAPGKPSDFEASVASIAGSDSEFNGHSGITPLTQPSVSNVFPSLSSANKETYTSSPVTSVAPATRASENNGETSSAPPLTSFSDEWRALTTPSLVTSICQLLCNLISIAPQDTVSEILQKDILFSLSSLLDINGIEALFSKLAYSVDCVVDTNFNARKRWRRKLLAQDLLRQHETTTRLFTMAIIAERSVTALTSPESAIIKNLLAVLGLRCNDCSMNDLVSSAYKSAFEFIAASIHRNIKNRLPGTFKKEWPNIYSGVRTVLKTENTQNLHISCLKALALLFRSEYLTKYTKKESDFSLTLLLEKVSDNTSNAEDLCAILIGIFEDLVANPSAGICGSVNECLTATTHALQNLFACSTIAQNTAAEAGFLERCVEELKRLHLKLSLHFTTSLANKASSSLCNESKSVIALEECDVYIYPMSLIVVLLTNLLKGQNEVKCLASTSEFAQILCQLWSWTSSFPNFLLAMLRLIVTYTGHCQRACATLVSCHGNGQPSVTNSLVKICRDVHNMVLSKAKFNSQLLALSFNALVNCAYAHECRAVMWKMSLLELFADAADRGQHPKRSRQQAFLLQHWLKLLFALSFHGDGQLNIVKIKDIFHIFVELHGSNHFPKLVLLIIRNLCFHTPSKNRISSNGPVVSLLMSTLNQEDDEDKLTASSALLALLFNNQKAKVHLKGAGLTQNLLNALARIALTNKPDDIPSDSSYESCLTNMLKILQSS